MSRNSTILAIIFGGSKISKHILRFSDYLLHTQMNNPREKGGVKEKEYPKDEVVFERASGSDPVLVENKCKAR